MRLPLPNFPLLSDPADNIMRRLLRAASLFTAFSRRKTFSWIVAGLVPLLLILVLEHFAGFPQPVLQDEFAYLLGADTFAAGRLTNPTHPLWIHFETFHINFQPTYHLKYPPAQALILAFGQKVFGHPWYGVWLSFGLMCAAVCWALQGWLPPQFALLTTMVGGMQLATAAVAVPGYWIQSYWGGSMAALGGALVLGAVPRLARSNSAIASISMAAGLAILANSRPFEGAVLGILAGAALLYWRHRNGHSLWKLLTPRCSVPFLLILALTGIWDCYYNYRTTGDPFLFPHMLHLKTYGYVPISYLQKIGPPPVYRHDSIRRLWVEWEGSMYWKARHNPLYVVLSLIQDTMPFYLGGVLAVPFCIGFFLIPGRKAKIAAVLLALFVGGILVEKVILAHYLAPGVVIYLVLIGTGLRYLALLRIGRKRAGFAVCAVFLTVYSLMIGYSVLGVFRFPSKFAVQRAKLVEQLNKAGASHLVIVRYAPTHNIHAEWVYNLADIDGSRIIWARDMGDAQNRELLDYYRSSNRRVWLLEPDHASPVLIPYQEAPR
jgi:hypothetical protein